MKNSGFKWLFVFMSLMTMMASASAAHVRLNAEEKAYLADHPVIRVSNEAHFAPFDFSTSGVPQGYSVDMLRLLAGRVGMQVQFVSQPTWADLWQKFQNHEIDLLHAAGHTAQREAVALYSKPYFHFRTHFIVRKDTPDIHSVAELKAKTVAVSPGWYHHQYMQDYFPDVKLLLVPDYLAQMAAVASGQADVMLSDHGMFQYMARTHGVADLRLSAWFSDMDLGTSRGYHFIGQKNAPELISILDKAIATITPGDLDRLQAKWFGKNGAVVKRVPLTLAETEFLANHPLIRIGGGQSFEPFVLRAADGKPSGHDVELAKMISDRTGLNFEFEVGPWAQIKNLAEVRGLDGLASSSEYKGYEKFYNKSQPYMTIRNFVFVKRGNAEHYKSLGDLAGKRVAVQRGNILYEKIVRSEVQNPEPIYVDTIHDQLDAIVSGKADYTVLDETAYYVATQIGLRGMIEDLFPIGDRVRLVFQLRNDWPELVSIFNKGLRSIPPAEVHALRMRWFFSHNGVSAKSLPLTAAEQDYLQHKGDIRVCVDVDWAPFSTLDASGKHMGMSAEYLSLFSSALGVNFVIHPTRDWTGSLRALQARECDLSPMMKKTPTRSEYLDFTESYLTYPYVVVTKVGEPLLREFNAKQDHVYAVLKDFSVQEDLARDYPGVRLLPVKNPQEGLQAVHDGRAFGYVGATTPVVLAMRQYGYDDLKINGKLPYGYHFSVGTRNDEPVLNQLMQKAVSSLTPEDHRRIQDRWLAMKVEKITDYTLLFMVLGVASLILVLVIYWNRKLQAAHDRTEAAMTELSKTRAILVAQNKTLEKLSITDRLTQIYNRTKLDELLEAEIQRARRQNENFGVILLDIDHFKLVNDQYGHKVGDEVLITFADVLRTGIRVTDVCGRWGGEEFLIICTGTNLAGCVAVAEKLRQKIEDQSFPVVGRVTSSFGVSAYRNGDAPERLLERADAAMYCAKTQGRNRVCQEDNACK